MKKRIISFRISILISILILLVPFLITLSTLDFIHLRHTVMSDFEVLLDQTENNIRNALELADNAYMMLELALQDKLEQGMQGFLQDYEEAGRDPENMDLEALKERLGGGMDLYIINAQGVIEYTSYEPDQGLDFTAWPDFYEYITQLRLGDEFQADRLTPETQTGTLRIYGYMPTPDHEYLLELGLVSSEFQDYIEQLNPSQLSAELQTVNPDLEQVRFITEDATINGGTGEAQDELIEIVERLWAEDNRRIIIEESGTRTVYTFIDLSSPSRPTDTSRVVELVFSTDRTEAVLFRSFLYHLTFSTILIIISILSAFFAAAKLSAPVHQLISDVNRIGNGDLDHKVSVTTRSELSLAQKSVNSMVDRLSALIQQLRESEKEIREYNENLEGLVQERTKQLLQAEKMAALGQLVSGVAHEINTPIGVCLTAVSNFSDLTMNISKHFDEKDLRRSDLFEYLRKASDTNSIITRNLKKSADLVKQFKGIAVIEEEEPKTNIHLKLHMRNIVSSLRNLINEEMVKIHIHCPSELIVNTYPLVLTKIVSNLVLNAYQHGFLEGAISGEIRIAIEKSIEYGNGFLYVTIANTGKPIAEDVFSKIYDPFFTTNRGNTHSGLGLHIVYNLVTQKLKGSIEVESTESSGTVFRIKIPL
ncbi:MAG: sensor histidine kinase [Spirochaetia bacterium]